MSYCLRTVRLLGVSDFGVIDVSEVSIFHRSLVLNSCIGVSGYNEPYSLCEPLLLSHLSTLGLTRSTQRHPTPLQNGLNETINQSVDSG
jgi:hypothetical protein